MDYLNYFNIFLERRIKQIEFKIQVLRNQITIYQNNYLLSLA